MITLVIFNDTSFPGGNETFSIFFREKITANPFSPLSFSVAGGGLTRGGRDTVEQERNLDEPFSYSLEQSRGGMLGAKFFPSSSPRRNRRASSSSSFLISTHLPPPLFRVEAEDEEGGGADPTDRWKDGGWITGGSSVGGAFLHSGGAVS